MHLMKRKARSYGSGERNSSTQEGREVPPGALLTLIRLSLTRVVALLLRSAPSSPPPGLLVAGSQLTPSGFKV